MDEKNFAILHAVFLFSTLLLSRVTETKPAAAQGAITQPVSAQARPNESALRRNFVVEWKQGLLTVNAERSLLSRVLGEIGAQTGIRFLGLDHLEREISIHVTKVPLSEAFRILLVHTDYAMIGNLEDPRAVRVIIAQDKEREIVSDANSSRTDRTSTTEEKTVQAKQPEKPAGTDADFSILVGALSDKDLGVKEAAVQALAQTEGPEVMDVLRRTFHDSDSAVKKMLLQNIGSRPDAVPLLLEASQDSEKSVREAAQLWLDSSANQP